MGTIPSPEMKTNVSVSVSVSVLANNAIRAHHASAHGGVSTNGLADILLVFLK